MVGDPDRRAFTVAVIGSLLLHVALLLLPMLRELRFERTQARAPIVARLAESPKVIVPLAPTERMESIAMPAPRPIPQAKKPIAAARPPSPAVETVPASQLAPAGRNGDAAAALPQSSRAARVMLPAAPATPAPAPGAPAAPDAGTVGQYRLAVIGAAKRYKAYPPVALENRWQGIVEVRMAIGADGSISSLTMRSSTGHSLLDAQAIDMVGRAQAAAQVPPALLGRQFVVDVPVEFALQLDPALF